MRTTNAAVASQLGRKLPSAIAEGMATAMQPIQDQLAQALGSPAGGQPPAGHPPAGTDPQIAKLLQQNENMQKQLEVERTARETQEQKTKDAGRQSALQNALAAAGVEPLRMRGAMAEVIANVQNAEDGSVVFKSNARGFDEELDLTEGIKSWASTDIGKSYLAPKNVQGSGHTTPGARTTPRAPGQVPADPAEAKAARVAEARAKLPGQVAAMLGGSAGIAFGGPGGGGDGE
jgi:hypothetical protein